MGIVRDNLADIIEQSESSREEWEGALDLAFGSDTPSQDVDRNAELAAQIVTDFQNEEYRNHSAEVSLSGDYRNEARDRVLDMILFALDHGYDTTGKDI